MKSLFVLATIVSFIGLIVTLLRLPSPRVPWLVIVYLFLHAIFIIGIWFTANYVGLETHADSHVYKRAFMICGAPMILAMLVVSIDFAIESFGIPVGLFVFGACACAAISASLVFIRSADRAYGLSSPTFTIVNHFVLCGAMVTCGAVTFVSLIEQSGDIEYSIKLALSIFWLSFGAYQFIWAVGKLNPHMAWVTRQDWVPTFAALVCCCWLIYKLNTAQRELTPQALPHVRTEDKNLVLSAAYQRRGM